ncbi:hypothetical protein CORC01_01583 [Colletotrichum orchidophilum]|uniref:Uncharacterized protein n=1 Tax=Colletotrichum orchidophilum TaxID=1209926 RepID=A0A1G4BP12_9PEZI|nr:uncharacterized protein CORC01_01583 [Colletotrichum orchidophilum]OHF03199.1 hypothetical protein CORC01_01583 [Colletotrichum orchidophilum]
MDSQSSRQSSRRRSEDHVHPRHRSTAPSPPSRAPVQTVSSQPYAAFPINHPNPLSLAPTREHSVQGVPPSYTQSAVGYLQPAHHSPGHTAIEYSSSAPAHSTAPRPYPQQPNPNYAGNLPYGAQPALTQTFSSSLPYRTHPDSLSTSFSGSAGPSSAASSYDHLYAASSAATTPSAANTPTHPLTPTLAGMGSWDNEQRSDYPRNSHVERSGREGLPPDKRRGGQSSKSRKDDQKSSDFCPRKEDDMDESGIGAEQIRPGTARNSPTEVAQLDADKIVHLEICDVKKRAIKNALSAYTEHYKRVAHKGVVIPLDPLYGLAINYIVFYWAIESTTPALGSLSLAVENLIGGGFPPRQCTHGTRYNLGSATRRDALAMSSKSPLTLSARLECGGH